MRRERESIETQTPHCPMCERPLEGINDYPKIVIKDLIVSHIPDFVRDIPREGNVAAQIKKFANLPEVKDYLKTMSAVKGNLIELSAIKPALTEYYDADGEATGYYKLEGKYYLHITDSKKHGIANVCVTSHVNVWGDWGFLDIAKLAVIKYEGVLNFEDMNGI